MFGKILNILLQYWIKWSSVLIQIFSIFVPSWNIPKCRIYTNHIWKIITGNCIKSLALVLVVIFRTRSWRPGNPDLKPFLVDILIPSSGNKYKSYQNTIRPFIFTPTTHSFFFISMRSISNKLTNFCKVCIIR